MTDYLNKNWIYELTHFQWRLENHVRKSERTKTVRYQPVALQHKSHHRPHGKRNSVPGSQYCTPLLLSYKCQHRWKQIWVAPKLPLSLVPLQTRVFCHLDHSRRKQQGSYLSVSQTVTLHTWRSQYSPCFLWTMVMKIYFIFPLKSEEIGFHLTLRCTRQRLPPP